MINDIKLIATDMDGTLLNSKKQLPIGFKHWVKEHPQIKFAIASGRQYFTLQRDFLDLENDLIFIAENGSLVLEKGIIIYQNVMKKEDVISAFEKIKPIKGASVILCGINSAYMLEESVKAVEQAKLYYARLILVTSLEEVIAKEKIIKLAIYFENLDAEDYYDSLQNINSDIQAVLSGDGWIDIANRGVNKGIAIEEIQRKFHIKKEESMAFGDYLNDIDMLKAVYYSYAMKNAHPDVRKVCRFQTDSNDEDGVMKVLRKL